MDENKLGKRILALRTERGLTQEEAAEKLGVSIVTAATWLVPRSNKKYPFYDHGGVSCFWHALFIYLFLLHNIFSPFVLYTIYIN